MTEQKATPKKWPRWAKAFLTALAITGNVTKASEVAKCDRPKTYELRNTDPVFAAAWEAALDQAADYLEEEARRRAHDGLIKKKFNNGEPVIDPATGEQYVEHEYSDTLLIFLLKGTRPEKYRERSETQVTATVKTEAVEILVTSRAEAQAALSALPKAD